MKNLVVDLDGTITQADSSDYVNATPNKAVINRLKEYKAKGFNITIATSRNMRTHKGNIGKINIHTLPIIIEWLDKHGVPYDEIIVGKPWCGFEGFYIDDKSIRPSEFISMDYKQINEMLAKEKIYS